MDIFQKKLNKSKINPVLLLAPMEGVTNRIFRDLICDIGSVDILATEFIRISNVKQKIKPLPKHSKPLQIQIMGNKRETIIGALKFIKSKGIITNNSWLDLNVGCPSKKVTSSGAGSALLLEPKRLEDIIFSIRELHAGPFSIKTRLGFQSKEEYPKIISMLSRVPLDFITIHARTKCDMYSEPIDMKLLKYAVEALPFPVIGNGDIWSSDDAIVMLEQTGVRGLMCGRGAITNPFLFCDIKNKLNNKDSSSQIERIKKLQEFSLSLMEKYLAEEAFTKKKYIGKVKEFSVWFSKNKLIGRNFFQEIKRVDTVSEAKDKIETYFQSYL